MSIADNARELIQAIHALSPYAWIDAELRRREQLAASSEAATRMRQRRLVLSERYIAYWLLAAIVLFILGPWLPDRL
ncbi:MAG: hypothetical protein CVV17_12525, partial [Gammaproteobacteria bacterium HGW-Gammaproteobacteria-7]